MTRLGRIRLIFRLRHSLYVVGIALAIGSLLGAKALSGGNEPDKGKQDVPSANPAKITGPVVLGTVDSYQQPIPYGLPPVLQSGTVVTVFVKEGDEVHAGDKLYEFDTALQKASLEVAQKAVEVAKIKVAEAEEGIVQHNAKVKNAEAWVTIADRNKVMRGETWNRIKQHLEEYYQKEVKTKEEVDAKVKNDDKLFSAHVDYLMALSEYEQKDRELKTLKDAEKLVALQVDLAKAGVKQAEAEVAKAQTAIELCTIHAKINGTIEQVTIGEGATLGVSTLKPALWLIPAGPRIVRAEIEGDFSHQVDSLTLKGKEVTIYDNTDPKLTYKGKVRRVSDSFLPKRFGNDSFLASDTRVREAVIEVIDAAPKGRPPLSVGQRVRVDLGQ